MELISLMQHVGLTEKQAKLYLALLELGSANVARLAQTANVKRPTAYVLLTEMLNKGFVTETKTARDRLFSPIPPDQLKQRLAAQAAKFDEVLPLLVGLMARQAGRPLVEVQEGKPAIIDAYNAALASGQPIDFFTDIETLTDEFGDFLKDFNHRAKKERRIIRELVPPTFAGRKYARESTADAPNRQVRLLGENLFSDTALYGKTVLVVSFLENNYYLVRITNPQISASFKALFNQLWRVGKPVRSR